MNACPVHDVTGDYKDSRRTLRVQRQKTVSAPVAMTLVLVKFGTVCPGGYHRRPALCCVGRTVKYNIVRVQPHVPRGDLVFCVIRDARDGETWIFRFSACYIIVHSWRSQNNTATPRRPPPLPSNMSVCTGAHTTCSDEPIPRDSNSDIIAGDVYSIQESIYAAVFDILRSSDIADRRLYAQCRVAAIRVQTREKATKKIRPCIAMNSHATTRRKADDNAVCLTTSWEKTPLTALPALFRFFSFPILRDCCDNSEHCHSLPAWGIDNAFVFAWEFKSERPFINRWPERQKGDPPEHPCTFGQNALEKIRNVCKAKKAEWAAKCKEDPEYAAWNARACLVSSSAIHHAA